MPKVKKSILNKSCIKIGTITTPKGLRFLTRPTDICDIVECRVDCLRNQGMEVEAIEEKLAARKNPTLLTLRTTVEGGFHTWKSTERILVFDKLLPKADAVDLEIRNMKYVHPILQQARDTNKSVILSSHSLDRKLTEGKALRIIQQFRSYRVDMYKLAGLARTTEDLKVLVRVLLKFPQLRLGVMATGTMASVSRPVLSALGSKLIYGYLDEPAADGQPSVSQVNEMLTSCGLE